MVTNPGTFAGRLFGVLGKQTSGKTRKSRPVPCLFNLIYCLFFYFVELQRHNSKCYICDKVGEKFGKPKFFASFLRRLMDCGTKFLFLVVATRLFPQIGKKMENSNKLQDLVVTVWCAVTQVLRAVTRG